MCMVYLKSAFHLYMWDFCNESYRQRECFLFFTQAKSFLQSIWPETHTHARERPRHLIGPLKFGQKGNREVIYGSGYSAWVLFPFQPQHKWDLKAIETTIEMTLLVKHFNSSYLVARATKKKKETTHQRWMWLFQQLNHSFTITLGPMSQYFWRN